MHCRGRRAVCRAAENDQSAETGQQVVIVTALAQLDGAASGGGPYKSGLTGVTAAGTSTAPISSAGTIWRLTKGFFSSLLAQLVQQGLGPPQS